MRRKRGRQAERETFNGCGLTIRSAWCVHFHTSSECCISKITASLVGDDYEVPYTVS